MRSLRGVNQAAADPSGGRSEEEKHLRRSTISLNVERRCGNRSTAVQHCHLLADPLLQPDELTDG